MSKLNLKFIPDDNQKIVGSLEDATKKSYDYIFCETCNFHNEYIFVKNIGEIKYYTKDNNWVNEKKIPWEIKRWSTREEFNASNK